MTARRERIARQVLVTSLVVGTITFVLSFFLLIWIGLFAGFLKLHLFEPPAYSRDWSETLWWVVVWGGCSSLSILSSWLFFRYAKKFIPLK